MIRRAFSLGLILALPLVGCGVPTDDAPRALPEDSVPPDLLAIDPITTTSTVPVGSSTRVRIYLVGGQPGAERLVPVERPVQSPPTVERVLSALTSGPNREELARGLRSAILPGTIVNSALVESGIVVVDLVKKPIALNGSDANLALAQMVYTTTELQGIGGFRLTLDGSNAEIPTDSGQRTGPVGRTAYASYAPL